jgi:hypothetical protein
MWRQVQGHPVLSWQESPHILAAYVHIYVYAHQWCNPRVSPSRQTQDLRDFLWCSEVRHCASVLRWYGAEREQEPTTCGLQNHGHLSNPIQPRLRVP